MYPLKLYIKNLPNIIMIPLALILNITNWIWLLWEIRPQDELIFLHYNILFGVDLIGPWWKVLYLPIVGLLIILINIFLGWTLFGKDKFFAYILNFVAVFCQVFLLLASSLLIFLNV
ncbi:hypothetical protein KJ785_03490 [Patescibacteria group bacterium]|nr:hypothetical protein [Patescibacteria group bacterium]